jgi:hypothetical protein
VVERAPKEQPPRPRLPLKPGTVWAPAPYEPADIVAVQALLAGDAEPEQQRRALRWIIEQASNMYEQVAPHYTESDRDTAFSLGRAYVGRQIVKLTRLNASREQGGSNVA